ncbi:MAG: transposase [Candidatus Thermoplasmatota archaeon]|nr:transposase [Candidatus Thermoplasmatota archaeon]
MNPAVAQQVNRAFDALFMGQMARAIKKLPAPWTPCHTGRPLHSPRVVIFCCILKVMTCRTYDGIEAYVARMAEDIQRLFSVSSVPGHTVIHRGMHAARLGYIRKLIRMVVLECRHRGMDIAVDSSGFCVANTSKWFDIRIATEYRYSEYLKLHIAVDIETGIIHEFTITPGRCHESPEFTRLLRHLLTVGKVMADKAFSSRKNCQLVADKQGTPYLCFKENATTRPRGFPAWKTSLRAFRDARETWLNKYHGRELVEAVFASIKQRWRESIASRKNLLRFRELALKVLVYNAKQLLCYQRAQELGVGLWTTVK